jgi:hypothetical protein
MVRSCAAVLVLMATALHAQDLPTPGPGDPQVIERIKPVTVTPLVQIPEPPEPPAANDAWTLQIAYAGGFTGLGAATVTIVSDGRMTCERPTPCVSAVAGPQLLRLTTTLTSILETAWIRQMPGICSDCMRTTIVLKRRAGGGVSRRVASWDDSQPTAPELRELRRLVFEIRADSSAR